MRSGCAYRSPSRMGDAQSFFAARGDAGPSDAIPVRALSPKYVVQCGPRADPSAVEVVPAVERVVTVDPPADPELVDDGRGVSEPDEHAANPHNANITIQRRIPREGRILRGGRILREGSEARRRHRRRSARGITADAETNVGGSSAPTE